MLNVLGLEQSDKDAIRDSFEKLFQKYPCEYHNELTESFINKIVDLQLLNDYSTVSIKNIVKVNSNTSAFYMVSIYLANYANRIKPRTLMYGLAFMKQDMKNILIRPETLWDKITDIFSRQDIDFEEHKGFSNKYCLFAKDKEFVKQNLTQQFLDEVYKMDKLYFEFSDKIALSTYNKPITTADTLKLAEFMGKIGIRGQE